MRLFITLFICSYLQSTTDEYIKKPINFDGDIIINNQENFISKGKILFRDGSFIYNLIDPYRLSIAIING